MFKTGCMMFLVAAAALLSTAATPVQAQTVKYRAAGSDALYEPGSGDYAGEGIGVRLGVHTIAGNVEPDGAFFPEEGVFFSGTFTGEQTVTAANGDTLVMTLEGTVDLVFNEDGLVEGTWFPNFTIIDGTGRFANASGTIAGVAINPPFVPTDEIWPFDWAIEGEIDLGKKGKK